MQRRGFLKALVPVAALVGTPITLLGHEGTKYEVRDSKRYVFVFKNAHISKDQIECLKKSLEEKGFHDPVLIGGLGAEGLSIFELVKSV